MRIKKRRHEQAWIFDTTYSCDFCLLDGLSLYFTGVKHGDLYPDVSHGYIHRVLALMLTGRPNKHWRSKHGQN